MPPAIVLEASAVVVAAEAAAVDVAVIAAKITIDCSALGILVRRPMVQTVKSTLK